MLRKMNKIFRTDQIPGARPIQWLSFGAIRCVTPSWRKEQPEFSVFVEGLNVSGPSILRTIEKISNMACASRRITPHRKLLCKKITDVAESWFLPRIKDRCCRYGLKEVATLHGVQASPVFLELPPSADH